METLTIIIAAYNENSTFPQVMDSVLSLPLSGLNKEIIVVESNSSDGTRESVLGYGDNPQVKIILEDKPMGKGHAVRAGLAAATGDYILIQDADLEYDINDYPKLLAPLISGSADFVLGSRHSRERRSWKIRNFLNEKLLQHYCNLGHLFFLSLFNIFYGQSLKDPFTMYKVFRRECLKGLTFTANRFDFDWELAGKLCRNGYVPLEIPVNYMSRGFKEGKKIRLIYDPITWVIACIKYRFCPLRAGSENISGKASACADSEKFNRRR